MSVKIVDVKTVDFFGIKKLQDADRVFGITYAKSPRPISIFASGRRAGYKGPPLAALSITDSVVEINYRNTPVEFMRDFPEWAEETGCSGYTMHDNKVAFFDHADAALFYMQFRRPPTACIMMSSQQRREYDEEQRRPKTLEDFDASIPSKTWAQEYYENLATRLGPKYVLPGLPSKVLPED